MMFALKWVGSSGRGRDAGMPVRGSMMMACADCSRALLTSRSRLHRDLMMRG